MASKSLASFRSSSGARYEGAPRRRRLDPCWQVAKTAGGATAGTCDRKETIPPVVGRLPGVFLQPCNWNGGIHMNGMGWKTITGGILGVGAWLFGQDGFSVQALTQAVGMLLGIFGARHAIAKSGK